MNAYSLVSMPAWYAAFMTARRLLLVNAQIATTEKFGNSFIWMTYSWMHFENQKFLIKCEHSCFVIIKAYKNETLLVFTFQSNKFTDIATES